MPRGGYRGLPTSEIFLGKIERQPNGCWHWTGALDEDGYGKFNWGRAHRYSYSYFKGAIPEGKCVCHECDNRRCVNPDHLWLGTSEENTADRNCKGRQARGLRNPRAISLETAVAIRYSAAASQRVVAAQFGVSPAQVSKIKRGLTWHFRPE